MRILAQSALGASGLLVLTALLTLYVVSMILGMFKRPSLAAVINLGVMLGVLYVGYSVANWPGNDPADGLIINTWNAWWGSLGVVWSLIWDGLGLDSLTERIDMGGKGPFA